jgi:hypothetical protein
MEKVLEEFETINNLAEMVEATLDPQTIAELNIDSPSRIIQSGGFPNVFSTFSDLMQGMMKGVVRLLEFIFVDILWAAFQYPGKDKGAFWKFIWFCIQCGFYLLVFAIAGPIFMLVGIMMVYGKLFKKMGSDPTQTPSSFYAERVSEASSA